MDQHRFKWPASPHFQEVRNGDKRSEKGYRLFKWKLNKTSQQQTKLRRLPTHEILFKKNKKGIRFQSKAAESEAQWPWIDTKTKINFLLFCNFAGRLLLIVVRSLCVEFTAGLLFSFLCRRLLKVHKLLAIGDVILGQIRFF